MAKADQQDPGPVPSEKPRGMAVTLPDELADYVRKVSEATGTTLSSIRDRLTASKGLAEAVRTVCSEVVDDHTRAIYEKLNLQKG